MKQELIPRVHPVWSKAQHQDLARTTLEKQRSMPCAVDKQKDEKLTLNLSVRI